MPEQIRVLLVEDSEEDAVLLLHELKRGGMDPVHDRADTAENYTRALQQGKWDIVIADYRLPSFSALAALELLKQSGLDLPFIIISGKIGEDMAVAAMKAGANDYMMKNNLSRLVPAIQRELRDAQERRGRREAEEALKNQFRQISTIFDSLNALVYVADMDSHELLFMNKFGTMLSGKDWRGRNCHEVLNLDPEQVFCTNEKLVQDGQPQPPQVWEFHNPSSGRWYQCIDKAVSWTDGKLVRLQIAVDISERKEIEQMKDEMISAVSHEMRTPLTAMMGFTEYLLENEVDTAQQKVYLKTIYRETERLGDLISNFLDLQQINARLATYRFTQLDVSLLIKDAVALFAIENDKHRLVVQCPEGLPPVRGDEARLHQVLTNLISNAVKYSPPRSCITIGACAEGDQLTIWVRDEGPGISPVLQEKIFEKFYRIDNTDRRLIGGTGLGLALVREIVGAHAGRVDVQSSIGEGSTFSITLPLGCE